MSSTKEVYKSFTVTKLSYRGFYPDLEIQFEDSIGKTIVSKWLGSNYDTETDVRSISFTDLTSNQRKKIKEEAKKILPDYIGSSSRRVPGKV